MGGQRVDQVAEQQALVDFDEPLIRPQRIGQGKLHERIDDDGGRGLVSVGETGEITFFGAGVTKKQLIGKQLLVTVQYGLAAKKNRLKVKVRHDDSFPRATDHGCFKRPLQSY